MEKTNREKMSKASFVLAIMNAQAERKAQAVAGQERVGRNPIDNDNDVEHVYSAAYSEMKREQENW